MPSLSPEPFIYLRSLKRGGASTATPAPTPTPTPSAITAVNANGWTVQPVTVPSEFDPDTPGNAVTFTAARSGYDTSGALTTFNETVTLTRRRRLNPYSTGSETDFATKNPSGETAVDRWLFTTDSGGFTNNSALVAPKPVAFCVSPDRLVIRNGLLTMRWVAFTHGARGQRTAPRLEYRVRDAGAGDLGWIGATWTDQFADGVDRFAVPGFEAVNVDISSLADGAITVDWRVKPALGGAASILSTEDVTKPRGVYQLNYTKTAAAATIMYVATTGNDTTGDGTTGNPYATIGKALNQMGAAGRDGSVIRVKDSMTWATTVTAAGAATSFVLIEKDPATGGAVTLTLPAANTGTNCKYLRFGANLNVVRAAANFFNVTSGGIMWFEGQIDCVNSGFGFTNVANSRLMLTGAELLNYNQNTFNDTTLMDVVLLRGVKYYGPIGGLGIGGLAVVGCDFKGMRVFNNASNRDYSGFIIAFNSFSSVNGTSGIYNVGQPSGVDVSGYAIVGNVFEWAGNAQTPHGLSRDASNVPPSDWGTYNGILWNNSYASAGVSGRMNTWYDDNNLTDSNTVPAVVRNQTVVDARGNVFPQFNIKGGQFVGRVRADLTNAPVHIGNVALLHGVGFRDNVIIFRDAQGGLADGTANNDFSQLYAGLNTSVGTLSTLATAGLHPAYASYGGVTLSGSTYTAGPGDGNYAVKDTSAPNYQRLTTAILPKTLGGTARTSPDHAGARGMTN